MATLDDLREIRIEKLRKLRELGVDPYPAKTERKETNFEALEMLGKKVSIAGRLMGFRGHGGSTFADLVDQTARVQLFFSKDTLSEKYELLKLLDLGDFIGIQGEVFKTQAGEVTVKVTDFSVLTKAIRQLPEKWHGVTDIETKLRKRYLDLVMNPEVREMFIKKAKFWQAVRKYLSDKGFLEVETPVLEAIPGGADARPFITHHHTLDIDLYLRISLELHLKRLMVGGYDKVFEVGRVFRNEGIDAEHLQDYTSMEFYWGYADYLMLMDFIEDFYRYLVEETTGGLKTMRNGAEIDWSKKWPRLDYSELFKEKTGMNLAKVTYEELKKKAEELHLKLEEKIGRERLIDMIYKKTVRPTLIQPCFLINLPVEISPLAKRCPDQPQLTQRMLPMAGGTELGNGFSELNDPIDQKERFLVQQKLRDAGDDEAQMLDEDFVEALEYGMPPTAGFGLSERLFSFLMDKPIRETVFFPTMRSSSVEVTENKGEEK